MSWECGAVVPWRTVPKATLHVPRGLHPDDLLLSPHSPAGHRVARVAVAALPLGFHILAEVIEDESRAALRRLTILNHRAQLGAILQPARLVVGEIRAEIDGRESLRRQALPASPT